MASPRSVGRIKQPKPPDAEKLDAYKILEAAYPVVLKQHGELAMTRQGWRDRNVRAARELVRAGKTPENVVAALTVAYTHPEASRFHGGLVMLDRLQEAWPRLQAFASGKTTNARPSANAAPQFVPEAQRTVMIGDEARTFATREEAQAAQRAQLRNGTA